MPAFLAHIGAKFAEVFTGGRSIAVTIAAGLFFGLLIFAMFGASSQNRNKWIAAAVAVLALAAAAFFADTIVSWVVA